MKRTIVCLGLIFAAVPPTRATDCSQRDAKLRASFSAKYRVERLRIVNHRVLAALTSAENAELLDLSARFNAIEHDTPEHKNTRFALQGRARMIARDATARAGYRLNNPIESPYDAEIGDHGSWGDYADYMIEVRSLLIRPNPHPHATLWTNTQNPVKNPWHVISVGVAADPKDDYVSWFTTPAFERVSGSVERFIAAQRSPECR